MEVGVRKGDVVASASTGGDGIAKKTGHTHMRIPDPNSLTTAPHPSLLHRSLETLLISGQNFPGL